MGDRLSVKVLDGRATARIVLFPGCATPLLDTYQSIGCDVRSDGMPTPVCICRLS